MRIYVQLGILSDIFDWILDNILGPVFRFLSKLIGAILTPLFENFLLPLLELRLTLALEIIQAMLSNFIYNLLFQISRLLLWVLDSIERVFRTLAGLYPVYLTDENGNLVKSGSLLLMMVKNQTIITVMLGMIMASVALCFLIAIFATIRAAGDLSGKRPVSEVLRNTARSLLQLILVPIMALGMVVTGDAVMQAIENATGFDHTPVSNVLFTMSTLDAVREDTFGDAPYYNASTRSAAMALKNAPAASSVADFGLKDKYRKPYYLGEKDRDNIIEVLDTFDIRRIDYLISVGLTCVFIFLFGMMAVNMGSRIFDCLLLLLVEPFFAAAIPLDEGEKFDRWKDLFLGRLISGYGTIVAMNLYLSIIGLIFSGKIRFFGPKTTPAVEYLVEILFVAIGAWTMIKAGPVVTGIMSAQAATREAEISASSEQITAKAAAFVTAPVRKLAGAALEKGWDAVKQGLSNATDGAIGGGSGGGGTAAAGTGAFGQMTGTGPTGVHFSGMRGPGGQTVTAPSGAAGSYSMGGGARFNSRMNGLGSARGKRPGRGMGSAKNLGAAPPAAAFGGIGMNAAPTAGAPGGGGFEDDFDTIFDVGGVSLFDEGGETDDGFDTVFDVGGRSLFDEGDTGPSMAFKGNGSAKRPVRKPSGGLAAPHRPQIAGVGSADFLRAGAVPGINGSEEYVWIGQRDEEERLERKKLEEQLAKDRESAALDAAESATGMDLNGDGILSGAGEIDLGAADFFGGDAISNDKLFGGDAISNDKLFGGDAISNDKLFGGDAISNHKLFGTDAFAGSETPDVGGPTTIEDTTAPDPFGDAAAANPFAEDLTDK